MSNVVNLFDKREEKKKEEENKDSYSWQDVIETNKKIKERKEKERLNGNKAVLRSYRIKN